MNILRTATLTAIFIKSVTASADAMSRFREAVDGGDMGKAVRLHQAIRGDFWDKFNYVVDRQDQEFIFNFAKRAEIRNGNILKALHRKKSLKMIEEAFKVFKFDQYDLVYAASEPELICSPDDLFNLLGKIENQDYQEKAIENGVENLFPWHTKCLDPLLNALENSRSFRHLKGAAINTAFKEGSQYGNKSIVERFHDHPAVTGEAYRVGLFRSGEKSSRNPIFIFLLGEANQGDLNAVKKDEDYEDMSDDFQEAIEDALLTAKPGETRSTLPIKGAKLVMKTFKNDPNMRIPTVIAYLIAFYLVDESFLK